MELPIQHTYILIESILYSFNIPRYWKIICHNHTKIFILVDIFYRNTINHDYRVIRTTEFQSVSFIIFMTSSCSLQLRSIWQSFSSRFISWHIKISAFNKSYKSYTQKIIYFWTSLEIQIFFIFLALRHSYVISHFICPGNQYLYMFHI